VLGRKVPKETYLAYLKSADWVGNDFYAVTGYNRPDWLWKVGAAVDELREWSNNKPQLAFLESSAQRLSWTPKETRGVTADELRAEIWHAVIHGVKGVVYFPQQIGEGFKYDATPPGVAMEMSRQNRRLNEMGAVLAGAMNPGPYALKVDEPLEAGWRVTADGRLHVIALNFSDKPVGARRIRIEGGPVVPRAKVTWESREVGLSGGAITEGFAPYEVKVYDIPVTK
jgi:hypothetical protein